MNTIRSAFSAIAAIDNKPAGQHPFVSRFMRAVFQEKSSLPRHHTAWDPETVIYYSVVKEIGHVNAVSIQATLSHLSTELVFPACAPDRRVCVYITIPNYLDRTVYTRGTISWFFLTTINPVKLASRDTLRRWTRDIMKDAGIVLTIFSPHSTRSTSFSKASQTLPVSTILATVEWSSESVFAKYYQKPLCKQTQFAHAVMA